MAMREVARESVLGEGNQRRDGSETVGGNKGQAARDCTRVKKGDAN